MPKNFGPCPLGVNSGKWGKRQRPVSTPFRNFGSEFSMTDQKPLLHCK